MQRSNLHSIKQAKDEYWKYIKNFYKRWTQQKHEQKISAGNPQKEDIYIALKNHWFF